VLTYDSCPRAPSEEPETYVAGPCFGGNEIVAHNPLPELISDGSFRRKQWRLSAKTPSMRWRASSSLSVASLLMLGKNCRKFAARYGCVVANVLAKMARRCCRL